MAMLDRSNIHHVELNLSTIDALPDRIAELPDGEFDLVVVDQHETPNTSRIDVAKASRAKLRPGGLLLIDDSDRAHIRLGVAEAFSEWRMHRFVGVKPNPLMAVETAVLVRPAVTAT